MFLNKISSEKNNLYFINIGLCFFILICFLCVITYGSGHNIPEDSSRWLISMIAFSLVLIIIFTIMKNKEN
ncbi:hypothetical protein FLBR109950_03735 [Flavobacterium branchiophilum]